MGWAGGSEIYDRIIVAAKRAIPNFTDRVEFHKAVIDAFYLGDWDTDSECLGQDDAFDMALMELNPDWGEDDE